MLYVLSIFLYAAGAAGAFAIYHFMIKRFKKQIDTIQQAPLTKVGQLQPGLHKANGTSVAMDKMVVSPLTQAECIFYHFKVEELRTNTQSGGYKNRSGTGKLGTTQTSTWVPIVNDRQAVACGLQDETGTAKLDLLGAEMILSSGKPVESNFLKSCPPELAENLKRRYDVSTQGMIFNKSLRFTEMIIRPGDKLFVVGDVENQPGQPPTFVKRANPFVISDRDEAGVLQHFRRSIIGGYVGIGLVSVIGLFAGSVPIWISSQLGAMKPAVAPANQPQPAKATVAAPPKKTPGK